MKKIINIRKAQKVNMGGIILDQALPLRGLDMIDPFLLIHHWADESNGGKQPHEVGVGPHPHRGFSPVTFIFEGDVHHRDSIGNSEVVSAGGMQWMNSGSGIVHSERPSKALAKNGGKFEIIQFWVNSPASEKMKAASYQPLTDEDTPKVHSKDNKLLYRVVNGEFRGKKGPIKADSELLILRLDFEKDGQDSFAIPEDMNALLYILEGDLEVCDKPVDTKDMVQFEASNEAIKIVAKSSGRAILLAGVPIKEPVSTYGPFVMNSQREIIEALNDYESGKMGRLVETFE